MPFWCPGNPLGDPFGPGVLPIIDSLEIADILCDGHREGLFELTAAHDDDLVAWDPNNLEDDLDESGPVYQKLVAIKAKLEAAGIRFHMITSNLHTHPLFRNGGLTNPDPRIRLLAIEKVKRALRIGSFLGADEFDYWVARDGYESPMAVNWPMIFPWIVLGLNCAVAYNERNNLGIARWGIETKPNEPRGTMYLPSAASALAIIPWLNGPWGLYLELLQHEVMAGADPVLAAAMAVFMDQLFVLHFGCQIPGQFDNDFPPLIGPSGLKQTISLFAMLQEAKWEGVVEFDCHMLRSDGTTDPILSREQRLDFIRLCSENYVMTAELLVPRILADPTIADLRQQIWTPPGVSNEMIAALNDPESQFDIDGFADLAVKADYQAALEYPAPCGLLDAAYNRAITGLQDRYSEIQALARRS